MHNDGQEGNDVDGLQEIMKKGSIVGEPHEHKQYRVSRRSLKPGKYVRL